MNLAIDAGGTNLRAEIYKDGQSIDFIVEKSREIGLSHFIEKILQKYNNIKNIGISYAGQVENGFIIDSPNIKVDVSNIKEHIETKYNIPLYIENDLTCAAIAEAYSLNDKNICTLYIGTGLGLGVIEDGKIIKGSSNLSCELGHIPYKESPLKCGCGRNNCIELFASGSGIIKWMKHFNLLCKPTLEALKNDSNPKSKNILQEFEKALLYATGTVITIFNPKILVLGGGIIEANPYLIKHIKNNIQDYALKPSLKNCIIIKTSLKDAPLKGALLLKDTK